MYLVVDRFELAYSCVELTSKLLDLVDAGDISVFRYTDHYEEFDGKDWKPVLRT